MEIKLYLKLKLLSHPEMARGIQTTSLASIDNIEHFHKSPSTQIAIPSD